MKIKAERSIVHRTYSGKTCEYKNIGLHGENEAEKEVTEEDKELKIKIIYTKIKNNYFLSNVDII